MIVCDSRHCREDNTSEPGEGRFQMETDAYGDSMGEYICYHCGEIAYECSNCDSEFWCSAHGNGSGPGELVTSRFSTDVIWINNNKEPVHVVN